MFSLLLHVLFALLVLIPVAVVAATAEYFVELLENECD
jgi:hypothetical protein